MILGWNEHPEARDEFLDAHQRYLTIVTNPSLGRYSGFEFDASDLTDLLAGETRILSISLGTPTEFKNRIRPGSVHREPS